MRVVQTVLITVGTFVFFGQNVLGNEDVLAALEKLTSKVDFLTRSMDSVKFLDMAYERAGLAEKLRDMSSKFDVLQHTVSRMETALLHNKPSVQPAVTNPNTDIQVSSLESKVEHYGKKILEQQTKLKNELESHVSATRTFKGVLETGINKIFTKMEATAKKRAEDQEDEILGALDEIKKEVQNCTATALTTRDNLDYVHTDLLSEWTTSHRQLREISIKLTEIKNTASSPGNTEELGFAAARVRTEFQRLEELEPKILHAVRVSSDLDEATTRKDSNENLKTLSGNLSSTLKGLHNTLEDRLQSVREGLEVIDEFIVNPQEAKGRSSVVIIRNNLQEILTNIDKKIDRKLQGIGDQVTGFLSTEVLGGLNRLRAELQKGTDLIRKGEAAQDLWRQGLQSNQTQVQEAILKFTEEMKNCSEPEPQRVNIRKDVSDKLRNSFSKIKKTEG